MPDDSKFTFSAETPYPEIHIHTQNMSCARWMLDNLGGVNSEISAVSLYFYNHLIIDEEYLKYGFSGYLLKPISKDKLFEIIDKYLK